MPRAAKSQLFVSWYSAGPHAVGEGRRGRFPLILPRLIEADWDGDGQRSARIAGAELSEPYATLLAEGLTDSVLAEAEVLTAEAQATGNRLAKPDGQPAKRSL